MVTISIVAICAVSWLLQLVTGGQWTTLWQFWPGAGIDGEPWRFFTAAFLHATPMPLHILFNMYALWITGSFLEPILGRARFVVLCVLAAVGGSVGVLVLSPGPELTASGMYVWGPAVVGASGMVFGLFGAMLPVLNRLGRSGGQILVLLAVNLVIGFRVPGIAWQAHLGGLVTGAVVAAAFAYAPRSMRAAAAWLVPVVGMVVLVVASTWKYASVGVL
ncbi:rhomboid family intramembrane serine protease [Antribacter gilvus]|uniref:rhomboid family intramembrane serine protease n=1 Tax=Antribacter gilvus TaxID=2304675 RepID=UPI0030B80C69